MYSYHRIGQYGKSEVRSFSGKLTVTNFKTVLLLFKISKFQQNFKTVLLLLYLLSIQMILHPNPSRSEVIAIISSWFTKPLDLNIHLSSYICHHVTFVWIFVICMDMDMDIIWNSTKIPPKSWPHSYWHSYCGCNFVLVFRLEFQPSYKL